MNLIELLNQLKRFFESSKNGRTHPLVSFTKDSGFMVGPSRGLTGPIFEGKRVAVFCNDDCVELEADVEGKDEVIYRMPYGVRLQVDNGVIDTSHVARTDGHVLSALSFAIDYVDDMDPTTELQLMIV